MMTTRLHSMGACIALLLILATWQTAGGTANGTGSRVSTIHNVEQFKDIVANSGDMLLVFDLYADWCMPCKIMSPMLEEIAKENEAKARFYKINVDKNPAIAASLGVSGIPFVVFVKNQVGVHAMMGVQPKAAYQRAINRFATGETVSTGDMPDGEIVEGVRVIRMSTATTPGDIYVYRGETVNIIIEKVDFPYSIHIPQYSVSSEAEQGKDLEVTFKAKDIGVFPMFCNGQCPAGDGARLGQIVVMQYKAEEDASFSELTVKQFAEMMKKPGVLVLDVRTPGEFYGAHIKGAKLIPLQQLESRWKEIKGYRDKDVLVYCRSGNRSTVASEILVRHGFKKLHNLRPGIKGWKKQGRKVVKAREPKQSILK